MSATLKQKGPAEAATSSQAGSHNPTKDTEMNTSDGNTTVAAPAIEEAIGDIWSDAMILQRKAYLLMGDVGQMLDPGRGKVIGRGKCETVSLMFTARSIDVTTWLAGDTWKGLADLAEKLDALLSDIERARP